MADAADSTMTSQRATKSRRVIAQDDDLLERTKLKCENYVHPKVLENVAENIKKEPRQCFKRAREMTPEASPPTKRFRDSTSFSPGETPTKGTSSLLNLLNVCADEAKPNNATTNSSTVDYLPLTPVSTHSKAAIHAQISGLEDLKSLFRSFLEAYSLFLAHSGAGTPLYLNELLARVTKSWKKRAVTVTDIRRLLGIMGDGCDLSLVDNGEEMYCLESKELTAQTAAVGIQNLIQQFHHRLERRWARYSACTTIDNHAGIMQAFLNSLPLSKVAVSEVALDPSKPTKGSVRLDLLRANQQATKKSLQTKLQITPISQDSKTPTAISNRSTNLIDRILAKQALSSNEHGPTKADLDRRAALDRVEDVALVLDFLAGSRPRASFSMQAVVQHLQNSMKNPIARSEVEMCVELMAKEVSPRFVSIIRSGTVYGVVITKSGRMGQGDLRKKVEALRG